MPLQFCASRPKTPWRAKGFHRSSELFRISVPLTTSCDTENSRRSARVSLRKVARRRLENDKKEGKTA
jgi:hypothetical protein